MNKTVEGIIANWIDTTVLTEIFVEALENQDVTVTTNNVKTAYLDWLEGSIYMSIEDSVETCKLEGKFSRTL